MKVYLVRHAWAEERHVFAQTKQHDDLRPLTLKGEERMEKVVSGFKVHEPQIDIIFQSPLLRSQQTAKIFKSFYKKAKVITTDQLAPGHSSQKLFKCLLEYIERDSVAFIGHEPDMGQFLSWMLFRQASDHFPFKKGGIAKLDLFKDQRCYLKWLLRPKFFLDGNNI